MEEQKVSIDKPHGEYGQHVDVITPLHGVNGVQKLRIGSTGDVVSEDINISNKKGA